jgi:hypothetical protein
MAAAVAVAAVVNVATHAADTTAAIAQRGRHKQEEKVALCFIECSDTTNPQNVQFFQKKDLSSDADPCQPGAGTSARQRTSAVG